MVLRTLPYIESVEKALRRAGWETVREGIVNEKETEMGSGPKALTLNFSDKRFETYLTNSKYQMVTHYLFRTQPFKNMT